MNSCMKVIINADDFGINNVVTKEIERMVESQAISSTTIMANGACLDEVKRFALLHPEISFGVHLCLSEFSSITKSPVLHKYGITDAEGQFIRKAIFRVAHFNDELLRVIHEELDAQIKVVKTLGIPLSHCDSHHHVHTIYPLKEVFAEVIKQNGFTKIRRASSFDTLRLKLHFSLWIKNIQINHFYSNKFCATKQFCSYQHFVEKPFSIETTELMCHPGHPGTSYKNEMELVESKCVFQNSNIKIISYNDL